MQCFLCKKNDFELVYKLKRRQIVKCQNDGLFLAIDNKVSQQLYDQNYYDNSPYSTFFNLNERYFLSKLKKIQKLTAEFKPTILDVGCGWGNFLEALQKQKMSYLGIDSSDEAIRVCRSKNLNCRKTTLQELVNENHEKFSAITLFQVIEHVADPIELLKATKKLLKKNGAILMTTPNNDSPLRKIFGRKWSVYQEPSHFVFYNQQTLKETLIRAGFKNVGVSVDSVRFLSFGYVLSKLGIGHLLKIGNWSLEIPLPTDPFGDLQAIAYNR